MTEVYHIAYKNDEDLMRAYNGTKDLVEREGGAASFSKGQESQAGVLVVRLPQGIDCSTLYPEQDIRHIATEE